MIQKFLSKVTKLYFILQHSYAITILIAPNPFFNGAINRANEVKNRAKVESLQYSSIVCV